MIYTNSLLLHGIDEPKRHSRRGRKGESQACLLDAIRSMLVEVKRDNSRSESGSAEGSAAVGESPEGAEPTAVGQSPTGAGPTAVRETILRYGGLRNFGETGHGEAPVLVEVGPEKDQPDQPGRASEIGVYPKGGGTEPGISRQHRPRGDHQGCARATLPTFWKQEEGIALWARPVRP